MTDHGSDCVPSGLADLTLEARRARDLEADREIQNGLASRSLAIAAEARAVAAHTSETLVRVAPALAVKLARMIRRSSEATPRLWRRSLRSTFRISAARAS